MTLFAAALAISGRAQADSLPAASGSAAACATATTCQIKMGSGGLDAESSTAADFGSFSAAKAQEYNAPSTALGVQIRGTNLFVPSYPVASASLAYYFTVVAPSDAPTFSPVPLYVSYSIDFLSGVGTDAVFGVEGVVGLTNFTLNTSSETSLCGDIGPVCVMSVPSDSTTFAGQLIGFESGTVEQVSLIASISFISAPAFFGGSVFIDPTFTIDPAFLQQNPGYSLQFSDGIGNTPDTPADAPEPATWAMMLIGFGGLGASLRHSRRSRSFS